MTGPTTPAATTQTRQNNEGTTDSQVRPMRTVTYVFNTAATTTSVRIPYAVAVDGVAQPAFSERTSRVSGNNGTITVTVPAGTKVALFLNSDAHPSYRQNRVYEVTPQERNIRVAVTERLGKHSDTDEPQFVSTNARGNYDLYRAPLTGDIWMKVSHKYTADEVDGLVPSGTRAEVIDAVKSIYNVLAEATLAINIPAAPPAAALSIDVDFADSNNPNDNCVSYELRADGLTRVHPGGYAALFTAAVTARASRLSLTSCWRPCLGSIAHRAGLGLDVNYVGSTRMLLSAPSTNVPAVVRDFRASLAASPRVSQLFDPWYMDSNTRDDVAAAANAHGTVNERLHRNHLHITVRETMIL